MSAVDGVALVTEGGRRIRLKWHVLRRDSALPAHDRASLAVGIRRGALMEVDLQLTRDGHWVCLHDDTVDAETTGTGPVAAVSRAELAAMRQRDRAGRPLATGPLGLDEVAEAIAADDSGRARVQLDLKVPAEAIGDDAIRRLAALLEGQAERFDLGAHDWPAVRRLVEAVPGLGPGFDPLEMVEARGAIAEQDMAAVARAILEAAPGATMFYLHQGLIEAGLAQGVDLVAMAHEAGAGVDCWTLEPEHPGILERLETLAGLGCDQITTNAPERMQALWRSR